MTTEAGREVQYIFDAVVRLGKEVDDAEPGDPELAAVIATVKDLQQRLKRARSVMGPLVPDAKREPSADEKSAAHLERALGNLLSAAEAKQVAG